jgi:hypothetical protein
MDKCRTDYFTVPRSYQQEGGRPTIGDVQRPRDVFDPINQYIVPDRHRRPGLEGQPDQGLSMSQIRQKLGGRPDQGLSMSQIRQKLGGRPDQRMFIDTQTRNTLARTPI